MVYQLCDGDISKADLIRDTVTLDEALDWIDLNNFDTWKNRQEADGDS